MLKTDYDNEWSMNYLKNNKCCFFIWTILKIKSWFCAGYIFGGEPFVLMELGSQLQNYNINLFVLNPLFFNGGTKSSAGDGVKIVNPSLMVSHFFKN